MLSTDIIFRDRVGGNRVHHVAEEDAVREGVPMRKKETKKETKKRTKESMY